jgi:hypothetical protein
MAGSSAGAGGSGGAPPTLTITPPATACGGVYKMDFGATHVEVDPTQGARVSALAVGGSALLATSDVTGTTINWGSTFWPSPQSWSWPPSSSIPAIDPNAYACPSSDSMQLTMTSAANTGSGPKMQVTKKFYADLAKQAVVIDYTLKNTGTSAAMVAPWEISRIPPGCLTFYPGTAPSTRAGAVGPLPAFTQDASDVVWYQQSMTDTVQYKLFDDGKNGWLATVTGNDVFVKQFIDVPSAQQFSNEAEIEIYSSGVTGGKGYVEMEEQGPLQNLAAGMSYTWTVKWYVRALPSTVTVGVSSASLVSYVQSLLQ